MLLIAHWGNQSHDIAKGHVYVANNSVHGSILCGKLITHPTKRNVDESGSENTEELHFFYDAQSRPAFVKRNNAMYRYVLNLRGL